MLLPNEVKELYKQPRISNEMLRLKTPVRFVSAFCSFFLDVINLCFVATFNVTTVLLESMDDSMSTTEHGGRGDSGRNGNFNQRSLDGDSCRVETEACNSRVSAERQIYSSKIDKMFKPEVEEKANKEEKTDKFSDTRNGQINDAPSIFRANIAATAMIRTIEQFVSGHGNLALVRRTFKVVRTVASKFSCSFKVRVINPRVMVCVTIKNIIVREDGLGGECDCLVGLRMQNKKCGWLKNLFSKRGEEKRVEQREALQGVVRELNRYLVESMFLDVRSCAIGVY